MVLLDDDNDLIIILKHKVGKEPHTQPVKLTLQLEHGKLLEPYDDANLIR